MKEKQLLTKELGAKIYSIIYHKIETIEIFGVQTDRLLIG